MHPAPCRAPGFVRGAIAFVVLAAPFAASATVVGFDLAATVNSRSASPANPALDLPPEVALGAEVTARIRYETVAVDTNPSPGRGEYNGVIREFVVRVNGLEFFLVPELPGASNFAVVRNDYLPPGSSTPADSFGLFGLNGWPPHAPHRQLAGLLGDLLRAHTAQQRHGNRELAATGHRYRARSRARRARPAAGGRRRAARCAEKGIRLGHDDDLGVERLLAHLNVVLVGRLLAALDGARPDDSGHRGARLAIPVER